MLLTELAAVYGAKTALQSGQLRRCLRQCPGERCRGTGPRQEPGYRLSENQASYGFSESTLHSAWRKAGSLSGVVGSRDGFSYRIIYPGRPADGAGPDFRDAILLRSDGKRIHGDIEIHVRSGDWHAHGHATDGAYNGVVLHVAWEESGAPAQTLSGMRVPLLPLKRDGLSLPGQSTSHGAKSVAPSVASATTTLLPLPFLDMGTAGDEWFRNRAHGSALAVAAQGVEQAVWGGALECLGYPSNKGGFRQLTGRLDWRMVRTVLKLSSSAANPGFLEEVFLWAAGFCERPAGAPELHGVAPEWVKRHGRPANRPEHRVRAAAQWAVRWGTRGGIEAVFANAVRMANRHDDLHRLFTVPGLPGKPALLGVARAADIVVNHLLPVVHALAITRGDSRLANRAKHLFETHPRLQSNHITREASALLATRGQNSRPRTALEQQGLIHIYRLATARQQPVRQLPLL
jgi:hypothetical protein